MLSTNLIVGLLVVIVVVLLFLAWQNQYCSDKHTMQARTLAGQTQALKADVKAAVKDVADVVGHTVQTVKKTVKDIVQGEPKKAKSEKKDAEIATLTELYIQENYEEIQRTAGDLKKSKTLAEKVGIKPCETCPGCDSKCIKSDEFGKKYPLADLKFRGLRAAYNDNCTGCVIKRFFLKTFGSKAGQAILKKIFEKTLEDLIVDKAAQVMPASFRQKFCGNIGNPEGKSAIDFDPKNFDFARIFGKTPEDVNKTLTEILNNVQGQVIDLIIEQIPVVGKFLKEDVEDIYNTAKDYLTNLVSEQKYVKVFINFLRRGLSWYLGPEHKKIRYLYDRICTGGCPGGKSINPNYQCWNEMLEARANFLEEQAREEAAKEEVIPFEDL